MFQSMNCVYGSNPDCNYFFPATYTNREKRIVSRVEFDSSSFCSNPFLYTLQSLWSKHFYCKVSQ